MALRLAIVAVLALAAGALALPTESGFTLSDRCPPGFEKTSFEKKSFEKKSFEKKSSEKTSFEKTGGVCELRNLYQFYDSLQDRGVGGTQTALPAHRDGFTPQQIDLGRYLFFDPALSGDGSISCASCHHPDKGFSDDRPRSIGIGGHEVSRAAPTLWNVAFLDRLFWDARAESLEEQAQGPLYSPEEMGNTPQQLQATLRDNADYRAMFSQAFPGTDTIELDQAYTALTAFQTSLISLNSRYDRYAHGYHSRAVTKPEIEGMNVFRSFVARCAPSATRRRCSPTSRWR